MTIYLIIALSFAIMCSYMHTYKVTTLVKEFVNYMDIDWGNFSPTKYHIKEFLYNFIMFPIAFTKLFDKNLIKSEVDNILETNYGLEAEK